MKNRVLGLALAMTIEPAALLVDFARSATKAIARGGLDNWGASGPRRSKKSSGRTVAMDKRDAAKRRNVLRARGQYRDAVR